ncbi:uncharacterized protein LY89DRAFT_687049 [Mollisia scopiformis]|uniref:Uncharacterized protein n=1 Tax=Mollisia scopiformis TaxID=149040 RepID=A0A194X0C1_MOLSC|nr:uncharacterized protein LY89DRAFT_687049 [Mollisia scopiformis]KUJ13641.1 hypothetical protein LY89DRAFT_687049 [Mollisia scopiformis]
MSNLVTSSCSRLLLFPFSSSAPLSLSPLRLAHPRIFRARYFQPRRTLNSFHSHRQSSQPQLPIGNSNYRWASLSNRVNMAPIALQL